MNATENQTTGRTLNLANVPSHILAHAERSYPTANRPNCPILGRHYDQAKLDCIRGRLRIEAENHTSGRTSSTSPALHSVELPAQNFSELTGGGLGKPTSTSPALNTVALPIQNSPARPDATPEFQPHTCDADPTPCDVSPTPHNADPTHTNETSDAAPSDPTPPTQKIPNVPDITEIPDLPEIPEIPSPSSKTVASEPEPESQPEATSDESKKRMAKQDYDALIAYLNQKNPTSHLRQKAVAYLRARQDKAPAQNAEDEYLTEIKACMDPRSPIDHLPFHRQCLLYELITDFGPTAAAEAVSLPEPDGWGLPLKEAACRRFQTRHQKRTHAQRRDDATHLVNQLLDNPAARDDEFNRAAERLFKMRLLQNLNDPASATDDINALFHTFTRLRRTELAERKLNADEKLPPY